NTVYADLEMFPMVCDHIAIGCVLAVLRPKLEQLAWYRRLFHPVAAAILLLIGLVVNRYDGYTVVAVFGTPLLNVCLAILIHRSVYYSTDFVGRILNSAPLTLLGTLSYSLYLWQQLFLDRHSRTWVTAFPQNLALAFATALAS